MAAPIINAANLAESGRKYRKTLLMLPAIGVTDAVKYMTPCPGVIFEETTGTVGSNAELGPYSATREATETFELIERTLKTHLGSCIETFEPNKLLGTLWAQMNASLADIKNPDMKKAVLMSIMKSVLKKLNKNLFSAVRDASGKTTSTLFDGFDTIAEKEITAGAISVDKGNLIMIDAITDDNAVDVLKSIYRKASDELQDELIYMYVSKSIYNSYCEDYKASTGSAAYNKEFKQTFLEGSDDKCIIVPLVSKKGSEIIQLTQKSNMLYGYGNGVEKEKIEVAKSLKSHFLVDFILTMFFGVEYQHIQAERLMIAKYKTV
jgi:hypothetical protein